MVSVKRDFYSIVSFFFSAVTDTEQKKDATTETKEDAVKKTTDSKDGRFFLKNAKFLLKDR